MSYQYNEAGDLTKETVIYIEEEFELRIPSNDISYLYNEKGLLIKKESLIHESGGIFTYNYSYVFY